MRGDSRRSLPVKTTCIAMAAIAAALAVSGAASARTATASAADPDVLATTVPYADLDLSHDWGAQTLIARVRQAARTVCGGEPSSLLRLEDQKRYRACMASTMTAAIARLNAPLVTALYSGGPRPETLAQR